MKIAIVHDDLIQFGGAEKLLVAMHEIWPDAPVYTSVASKKWLERAKHLKMDLVLSFMQRLPFSEKLNRYYSPFLTHAMAFESFNFDQFDVVLSSSSRYAHSVITKPDTLHISYMNSPGRMFWEAQDYFEKENFDLLSPLKFLSKPFLSFPLSYLRQWDYVASKRPDFFIANSKIAKSRIKKYYGKEAEIIYPFVNFDKFKDLKTATGDYFVILTRLVSWKRVDLAIAACNRLGLKLKIIGKGPDLKRLKSLAGSTIEFLGYAADKKEEVLANCIALINTQKEDFGIVPLEAMAFGKPVIAYKAGGVLETVVENITGLFFTSQTEEALVLALQNFNPSMYSSASCRLQAKKFEKKIFLRRLETYVTQKYQKYLEFLK